MNITLLGAKGADPVESTGYFHWGTRFVATDFSDVKRLHAGHRVRRPFSWKGAQSAEGGPYSWTNLDNAGSKARSAGIPLLGVLSQTPEWATPARPTVNTYPSKPGTVDMFVEFCRQAAARYKNDDVIWEIYNEPNLQGWTSAQVQAVLIAAGNAIHESNPNAIVGGLVIAGSPTSHLQVSQDWVNAIIDNPACRAAMDVFTFHNYCRPYAPEIGDSKGPYDEQLTATMTWANSHGWTGDFWVTEYGYPTMRTELLSYTTEENQAKFLPRATIIMASYPRIKQIYQFQLQGAYTDDEEGGMGLIRPDGTDKPAFATWKTMCSILDQDLISISRDKSFPSGSWVYRFNKTGGKYGYCLWTVTGTVTVPFTGLPSTVRLTSLFGSQQILNPTAGNLSIVATGDLQYLEVVY